MDQVKALWRQEFDGPEGREDWESMSEDAQREWFATQLSALVGDDPERTPGNIDVLAEWEVPSSSTDSLTRAQAVSSGYAAPTDTPGYRTLVEAAVAAERPDIAVGFARHLLESNMAQDTPMDTWNVMLYLLPADHAVQFLRQLIESRVRRPDVHSYTAVRAMAQSESFSTLDAGDLGSWGRRQD